MAARTDAHPKSTMKKRLFFANIFNILDVFLTLFALHYGIGYEGNVIMAQLVSNPLLFTFIKISAVILLTFYIGMRSKNNNNLGNVASWVVFILMLLTVVWNTLVIAFAIINTGGTFLGWK